MVTEALAGEAARPGVRVNALAPGSIATDETPQRRARPDPFDTWMAMTARGRRDEALDLATTAVFLASDAASYITGAIPSADGGCAACQDGTEGGRCAPAEERWTMSELKARESIVAACLEMNRSGINQGTSGNISLRWQEGLLITPTSLPYDKMTPEDIVFLHMDGRTVGDNQPSSEWRFHRDIMQAKPEVNAIVHAHPMYSTIIAIMGKDIPPLHYMVAIAGGHTIPIAPYATFGTEELSQNAVTALKDRTACLLQHHGLIATGPTLDKAMWLAVEVETLAHQYHGCLQVGGPPLLPVEEIDNVRARMGDYGHRPKSETVA